MDAPGNQMRRATAILGAQRLYWDPEPLPERPQPLATSASSPRSSPRGWGARRAARRPARAQMAGYCTDCLEVPRTLPIDSKNTSICPIPFSHVLDTNVRYSCGNVTYCDETQTNPNSVLTSRLVWVRNVTEIVLDLVLNYSYILLPLLPTPPSSTR